MDRFPKSIVIGGACLLGLTVALGWGGVSTMIRGQFRKQVRLINHTDTYRNWKDMPIPIFLSVTFFNLTNPDDLMTGGKPKLVEMGPYVYMQQLYKVDIAMNISTEDFQYRQIRNYFFQPELSSGSEDDMVTIPNIPLLGMAKIAGASSDGVALSKAIDEFISKKEEMITRTHTVREFLFDGIDVKRFADFGKVEEGAEETEAPKIKIPSSFSDDKYGFYKNRNGSDRGLFEIHNGRNKTYLFGEVTSWNEETELSWWEEPCNKLNGTDGIMFQPFLNESFVMDIFDPDYCRTVSIVYNESVVTHGINAFRFVLAENTFQGTSSYRDNWCFCPKEKENGTACDRNGVYDVSPCHEGMPMMLSKPHFLDADSEIINGVEGVSPDPELHDTFIYDLHPMSGISLKSIKRFQYNIELMPYPNIPSLAGLSNVIVPVFWYQESSNASKRDIMMFTVFFYLQMTWDLVKYAIFALGAFVLGIGLVLAMTRKTTDPDRMALVK